MAITSSVWVSDDGDRQDCHLTGGRASETERGTHVASGTSEKAEMA